MSKLDVKDKKLLYYLSQDCRQSDTQLSRKIGLSKNGVKYRIERLQKENVIKKFAAVINIGSVKLNTFTMLLRFNDDIYENKDIINYFNNHRFADWVVTMSGNWDIFVEFVFRDIHHLSSLVKEVINKFSNTLSNYQVFFSNDVLRVEHLVSDFYKDLKLEEPVLKERGVKGYDIDAVDKKILNLLNQDSSLPYLQIAQRLNTTIDVIRYRIKHMINKGIIIKFFSDVSLPKLGYTEYLYTIKLRNISKEMLDKIKKRIQTDSNITYAFIDTNGFNIIFVCAFRDSSGIDHLSRSLRKDFKDIIEEQNYLIIKEQVLFNLFPKGLLD